MPSSKEIVGALETLPRAEQQRVKEALLTFVMILSEWKERQPTPTCRLDPRPESIKPRLIPITSEVAEID